MQPMRKILAGRIVEWDDEKAEINKAKHGISFNAASLVFADKHRLERLDASHGGAEKRWIVLGKAKEILFVVYTERNEASRIISARKANAEERKIYHDYSQAYL